MGLIKHSSGHLAKGAAGHHLTNRCKCPQCQDGTMPYAFTCILSSLSYRSGCFEGAYNATPGYWFKFTTTSYSGGSYTMTWGGGCYYSEEVTSEVTGIVLEMYTSEADCNAGTNREGVWTADLIVIVAELGSTFGDGRRCTAYWVGDMVFDGGGSDTDVVVEGFVYDDSATPEYDCEDSWGGSNANGVGDTFIYGGSCALTAVPW